MDTWNTVGQVPGRSVFICGSPYAEVSSVAWALTAHPAFWTSSESRFLFPLFGNRPNNDRPYLYDLYQACNEHGAWLRANAVLYPEFLAALGAGIARLFQSRAGRRRWIDSSPENALLIDELLYMFPDAAFVGLSQPARTAIFITANRGADVTEQMRVDLTAANQLYTERLSNAAAAAPNRVYLLEENDLFERPANAFGDLMEFLGEESAQTVVDAFSHRLLCLNMPLAEARDALARFDWSSQPAPIV